MTAPPEFRVRMLLLTVNALLLKMPPPELPEKVLREISSTPP